MLRNRGRLYGYRTLCFFQILESSLSHHLKIRPTLRTSNFKCLSTSQGKPCFLHGQPRLPEARPRPGPGPSVGDFPRLAREPRINLVRRTLLGTGQKSPPIPPIRAANTHAQLTGAKSTTAFPIGRPSGRIASCRRQCLGSCFHWPLDIAS